MKHIIAPPPEPERMGDLDEDDERRQFERDWDQYVANRRRQLRKQEERAEAERRGRENCRWPQCRQKRLDLDPKRTKAYLVPLCEWHFEQLVITGYSLGIRRDLTPPPPQPPGYRSPRVDGYIYYLRVGETIKIGFASNLRSRISQYPPNSVFLLAHKGTRDDEKDIHAMLLASRSHGKEWYRVTPEVSAFIEQQLGKHEAIPDPRPKRKTGFTVGRRNGAFKI